jgi:hypothetical protein
MRRSTFFCVAMFALVFAMAVPALAQTAPAAGTTNMEILAAKLKADKRLLVAQTVGLTDAEGKAFWPIYDAYQAELDGINKRIAAAIAGYATDYNAGAMTDAKAAALMTEVFAIDDALMAARKACAAKLAGVIPASKIVRYVQVENKVRALVNFELAAGIPFVP